MILIKINSLIHFFSCKGTRACAQHQAVGGGGGRNLQELLHADGQVQGEGSRDNYLFSCLTPFTIPQKQCS